MKDLNWKINRDEYYKPLFEKYGEPFILEAGFIYDSALTDFPLETDLECIPYSFLIDNLAKAKNPCILLTTGSFNPIHDGHIEMMFKAREACIAAGYDVLGGYFAPDHDEYVSTKANYLNGNERVEYITEQLKNFDWLAVDPWNAIFNKNAVNFTDILVHLQRYLKKYLDIDVPIFFVCGGDNAKFSLTFYEKGYCVMVDRPGSSATVNKYKQYVDGKRILYAFNDNPNSSTAVRKILAKKDFLNKKLLLRVENDGKDERGLKIYEVLKTLFSKIQISNLNDQKEAFSKFENIPIISLDSLLKSETKLELSRCYDFFGTKSLGIVNRPGTEPLEKQIEKIKGYEYFLFDDDIHSGGTMNFAKKLLSTKLKILGLITLNKSTFDEEILDLRDFFYGTENCGLVIKTKDGTKRYPYIYPYVDPYSRASIKEPLVFSAIIWKINRDYWKDKDEEKFEFCKKKVEQLAELFPC